MKAVKSGRIVVHMLQRQVCRSFLAFAVSSFNESCEKSKFLSAINHFERKLLYDVFVTSSIRTRERASSCLPKIHDRD